MSEKNSLDMPMSRRTALAFGEGVEVNTGANLSTNVQFKPQGKGEVHCLYNRRPRSLRSFTFPTC
jgi:hypothetical protein